MPEVFIQILNPSPGRASHLGYRHALRYVKQGRAEWAGSRAIRFLESDHRHLSAERLMRAQTAAGYDARGLLKIDEIKRLPTNGGDPTLLLIVRRRVSPHGCE